jgi:uncharacterized protein (TIGR00369 family)
MPSTPRDPNFESRVRSSFARQTVMQTIGATLTAVEPGKIEISMPFSDNLTQQNGYLHAGVVATILDSACGYAAVSLMPADVDALTVEYKINLLRPAQGELFVARAHVIKAGRTLTFCQGEVVARTGDKERVVASMMGTIMTMAGPKST